eukprot:CAMPEP_0194442566 /NCGR_PEP_ID=MMETSP0176-20130528/126204_1 /TAXON_ID=216777 /ORGANISM="Proboscia alata, Strain PI-D3" /LENGTH=598 /DNA_ID=CAMNT_0039268683 /DNA_START=283 /DNA_END=2078 /DNA_ORIENTATION=+
MSSVEVDINNPPPSKITFLPESAVEVTVTAPAAATKAAYEKTALELSKTISIPGFRKGAKIAPQVLESHMASKGGRNAIKVEAIKALLAKLVDVAVKEEHKLDPIGQPVTLIPLETLAESFVPGKDFTMGVKCDVWPTLKWAESEEEKPYHGLSGKYSRKPYDETKFNLAMKDLRDRYAVLEDMPDGTKLDWGDACTVNMVGYMSNDAGDKLEPLPNTASGENVEVVLGKGRYMEGLVEGLVGAAVGETKTVQTAFPERLKDKTLAGKKAVFDVSILQSSTRKLPELDDEFANDVRPGMDIKTLRDELQKAVDEEDAKEFVEDRNKALSEALATRIDIEMPDSILVNQAREKYAEMMTDFRTNGMSDEEIQKLITPENFLKYKNIVKPAIVNDFKVTLGTEEIAKLESVEVPAYRVDEQMASLKKESEQSGEEFDEAQVRPRVENTLQRRMVFDYLAENGNLEVEFKDEEGGEGFDAELMDTLAKDSIAREETLAIELEEKDKAEAAAAAAAAADAESDQGKQQQTVDDSGNGGGAAAKLEEEAKAVVEAETKAKAEEEARIVAEAKSKAEEEARIAAEEEASAAAAAAAADAESDQA